MTLMNYNWRRYKPCSVLPTEAGTDPFVSARQLIRNLLDLNAIYFGSFVYIVIRL